LAPEARLLAFELIETVTVVVALGANDPLVEERVIQLEFPAREADQLIENPPVLFRV
jgi:hypothetical protein